MTWWTFGGRPALALPLLLLWFGTAGRTQAPVRSRGVGGQADSAVLANPVGAPRPEYVATPTDGPILVDGNLDEEAWRSAAPLTGFVQQQPQTGARATERTVVRILYDRNYLYVGAECFDAEGEHLTVMSLKQDFESRDTDMFGIMLDTFLDRRNSFLFGINPRGAVKDGQGFNDGRVLDWTWEGPIEVRTRIRDSGWTVELAIPFATLRFDPSREEQVWGLQLLRRVRRKNENAFWAPIDRRGGLYTASLAGTLRGIAGIRSGRNVFLKPYVLAGRSTGAVAASTDLEGGFDVKVGVTAGLTLDLTVRTDFSQVEVDQERVNLTRFSLFFPEKRDFFIENSGIFAFGDVTEPRYRLGSSLRDFTLFHSRRIGLDDRGQPIPIVAGGRLTGRSGAFELGVLDMQTRAAQDLPSENFGAIRVRRNLFGTSDVGAIFVNRQATEGEERHNRTYGVDANFTLFGNLLVNSYLARVDDPGVMGDDWAGRISAAWRDRIWDVSAFVKRVGEGFRPGLGFVRRSGRQRYVTVGAHPRPSLPWVQEVNPYGEVRLVATPEGILETRTATLGVGVEFLDGSVASLAYTPRFERLFGEFRVQPGAVVPAGDYEFTEATVTYGSSAGRPLSGEVSVTRGGFFHGTRTSVEVGLLWRANYHLAFDFFANHNRVELPGNAFTADVFGLRVDYAYSTRFQASAFVQYNVSEEVAVSNLRLNVIHAPLSDIFVVYVERRGISGSGVLVDRELTLKATKLLSF